MNTATLKRSGRFYLTLIVNTVILLVLGTILFSSTTDEDTAATSRPLFAIGIAFYALAVYTIYKYLKNAPPVTVSKETITVGRNPYKWHNLQEVKLAVKCNFPHLFPFLPPLQKETLALLFNDGKIVVLYDDMYSNAWQLKLFVQQEILKKETYHNLPIVPVTKADTEGESFTEFAGNQLGSGRGIALWFVLLLYVVILFSSRVVEGKVILLITGAVLLWRFSRAMHYFQLSRSFLVIRRHNLPFIMHIFRINDIYMVKFESGPKMPFSLRVITKDFKSRLYPAATLHKQQWLQLKAELRSHYIPVEDELF